jgi:zinc/manganese transport system ATP-binding protein
MGAASAVRASEIPGSPGDLIELRAARAQLGRRVVWQDVTLSVRAGEFVAVLGPNGSGKSTLLKAILGLVRTQPGAVSVLGCPPGERNREIGYLPQRPGLEQPLPVRGVDLVRLGLDGHRFGVTLPLAGGARRRRLARERVRETIDLVGAGGYAERPLTELSGGERQRILIAQAFVRRPRLLMLDEPFDSLDLPNQVAVTALLRRVSRSEGVAVVLVAHDVNPLLPHIDQVVYLAGGRALQGPVREVITASKLSELYGAPIEVLSARDGRLVVIGHPDAPHVHGHRHD